MLIHFGKDETTIPCRKSYLKKISFHGRYVDFCKNTEPCVSTIYGAGNLPTTVVISPEGIITKIKTGVVDTFWLRSVGSGN